MNQLLCTSHTFCCNPGRTPSPEFTVQEEICTSLAVGSLLLLATEWNSWGGMLLLACFCVRVSLKLPLLPIACFVWTALVERGIRHSAQVQTSTLWCLSQDSNPLFLGDQHSEALHASWGRTGWTRNGPALASWERLVSESFFVFIFFKDNS